MPVGDTPTIDATNDPATGVRIAHSPKFSRYLTVVAAIWIVFVAGFLGRGSSADHFGAIPLRGDYSWYLDFGGNFVPEIQDEDLFYHNIGNSIAEAKKADVIFLGPSFVAYALDPEMLRQFGEKNGIKLYNMSFIGIRGGEFSREIIKHWDIHPKLWVINVDDQFIHFFSRTFDLTLGPRTVVIPATNYGRLRGWLAAASRNMRWHIEYRWANWRTGASSEPQGIYRRTDDGSVYLGFNPKYAASDNRVIRVDRNQDCHTSPAVIDIGRGYLGDIGGRSMFMLVPHSQYCPQQARELAQALGVEAMLTPDANYTTVDGGGHLDHNGALAFTRFLLSSLEKSATFQAVFPASAPRS